MKKNPQSSRSLRGILHALAISLATLVLIPQAARAATITKANNTENLNLSASWTGGAVPGTADIAQWTSTVTATNPTVLGADLSLAGISIVNPGGLVTINPGNTLTIGTSGIDLSTATQDLTLNSGLTLLGKQSWKAAAGRTLTVGGTFTRTGSMVDFTSFNATATLTGLTNEASGILGPWATTGSETSMNYVKSTAGAISAYTGQTPSALSDLSDVTNAGVNYSFATAGTAIATLSAPITANTLLYTGTGTQSTSAIANNGKTITVNGLMGNSTARFIISGTGNLMIGANKELVCNYVTAYSGITCPIVNYNDGSSHVSSVTINLNRASGGEFNWGNTSSTYSGGTTINNGSSNTIQFNITSGASAAFGTGPITLNGNITLRPTGTTFANNITINKNSGVTVRNNSGTTTTFNGNITLDSSIIFANAGNNQSETLNGNVTGAGGITLTQPNLGCVVFLTGTNTYTGPTAVNNGLLKAGRASMANVSGAFGLNSAVTMANSANARIDLNSFDTQIGSLTGGGPLGGNVINSHATIAATLTVGGNNTSPAAYAGLVSGSRLALTKIGTGKQILSGANTYTGDTVVQNGTLTLSPTVAGGHLADAADVKLYTGGILELNTSSTDIIRSLYIDGVPQATGEWGSATSGAANQSPLFTGTGKLNVGTAGSALTYSISGTVTLNGVGLAGVTVSDGTRSATTASDGTYTIASVPDNATYTVTASLGGYTLTPSSVVVTVKGANVTGNNNTAAVVAGTITLTGPLGAVNTTYGTASATPTSFTVSATGLTPASGNLAVAALSGYEYSTTSGGTYSSTLSLPYTGSALSSTSVFVRLAKAASVGSSPYSGNISVSGGGATVATIATASSTVSAASLTITANNQNKPFGTTQATPVSGSNAFTALGLQNEETVGSVTLIYGSGGLLDTAPLGSTSTITPSEATGGTFTAGNYSITYSADSGTLTVIPVPVITLGGTLAAVDTTYGTASATPTSFMVTASALTPATGDLTVTPPSGYEVSSSLGGTYSPTLLLPYTGSALSSTEVFVRLAASTAVNGGAGYAGDITIAGGSTSQTIATASSTVAKATATVVVTPYTVTYNGTPRTASVTSITGVNEQTGATVGSVTLSTTHTAAGIYSSDSWSFTGTANYNNIGSTTITNTINKATATVVVTPYTVAYDGAPHSATVTLLTGVNGETGATVGTVTLPAAQTNAGTYNTDAWSFTGTANYNDISSTTITNTINKATLTEAPGEFITNGSFETGKAIPLNWNSGAGGYIGVNLSAGPSNTDLPGWFGSFKNWYDTNNAEFQTAPNGTRFINLIGASGTNKLSQSFSVEAGVEYTVSYYEKDRAGGGLMDVTLTVDLGAVSGTTATTINGTSTWAQYGFTFTPSSNATATLSFENGYTPSVRGDGDGVFLDSVSVMGTGGGTGGLVATSIIEGQALSDSTLSGTFKNAAGATVPGALTFDSPTTIPAAGIYSAAVTFTPTDADNYSIWTSSVNVTVIPATPTITAGAISGAVTTTYGTASTPATFTVSGVDMTAEILVTAPTGFEVSQSSDSGYGATTTIEGSDTIASTTVFARLAATAAVTGSYNAKNIVLSSTGATNVNVTTAASGNTVSKATLSVTANNQTKGYGQTLAFGSGSALFTSSSLQNGETIVSVTLACTGGAASAALGTYPITPSAAIGTTFNANNYNITYNTGELTVLDRAEFAFGTTNTGALVLDGDGLILTRGQTPIIQITEGSAHVHLTYARLKNSGCTFAAEFSSNLDVWLASNDASLIYPPDVPTEVVVDNGDDMEIVSVMFPISKNNAGSIETIQRNFCRIIVTVN